MNVGAFAVDSTYIVGKSHDSDVAGWRLGTTKDNWGTLSFNAKTGEDAIFLETDIVSTGRWLHVTTVFVPGGTTLLYLDGVRVASTDVASSPIVPAPEDSLRIGCKPTGTAFFVGVLDEVRLYRRALSADEILGLARP